MKIKTTSRRTLNTTRYYFALSLAIAALSLAIVGSAASVNVEDYVLSGKSEELEPYKTFDNMTLTNGAVLTTYGVLHVNGTLTIEGNSKLLVKTFDESIPGSGTLTIYAGDILITEGSTISADNAGNDGRGASSSGGAGYGGRGGGSGGGSTYGTESGGGIYMGSKSSTWSKYMGGGAISLICYWFYIDGSSTITSNGGGGKDRDDEGGSGGGILIDGHAVYVQGSITASGGTGGRYSFGGCGGGGRIKINYFTKEITGVVAAQGGKGEASGQDGTVWYNVGPEPPTLISPEDGAVVTERPTFQFSAIDRSDKLDGRDKPDRVKFRIELSQDNFKTIAHNIDQSAKYVFGWVDETGNLAIFHDSGAPATYSMSKARQLDPLPEGTYQWRVFANDGKESLPSEVRTFIVGKPTSEPEIIQPGVHQTELSLTKGINIISLSLKPDTTWTAKTIVKEFGATIVIRAVDSNFEAYVAEGDIGEDFPIEANKGYIVNVTEPVNYTLLGKPWGDPVAAPSIETEDPTWAFVVTGVIQRKQSFRTPNIVRIANLRTGESTTARIDENGRFIAAFVDFNRRSVVEDDDAIELSFIGRRGNLLSKVIRRIEPEQIERAYLNTVIELRPVKTALFQNYPNPFNPETWIPYQIAQDAQVTIAIFNIAGELIRSIELGDGTAGWYMTKDRAAYWNGCNETGEVVSSGIYFYKLSAGNYSAVRKMLIVK